MVIAPVPTQTMRFCTGKSLEKLNPFLHCLIIPKKLVVQGPGEFFFKKKSVEWFGRLCPEIHILQHPLGASVFFCLHCPGFLWPGFVLPRWTKIDVRGLKGEVERRLQFFSKGEKSHFDRKKSRAMLSYIEIFPMFFLDSQPSKEIINSTNFLQFAPSIQLRTMPLCIELAPPLQDV